MTLPTTRAEAKALAVKTYDTGEPCPKGHLAPRYVNSGKCVQCNSERCAKRRTGELAEQVKAEKRAWHQANKEAISAARKMTYRQAPEAAMARANKRYEEKRDQLLEQFKTYRVRNWEQIKERRRAGHAAQQSKRKAEKLRRTPHWLSAADKRAMKVRYAEARWMTLRTGIRHEVDHFFPLQGDFVSGLHVPANLRVIPARDNWKKRAKLPAVDRIPL